MQKNKLSIILTRYLIVLGVLGTPLANAQGFVKAQGDKIVDTKGHELILRGMGLGGWMLQEGYMLQIHSNGMQHAIKNRITELIGEAECQRFYDLWLQNHMTKADVDSLAQWGFNSIRLPMHYNLYTLPIEQEPVPGTHTWLEKGFAMTDSLVAWCKANSLYLILDLHAAPGGQGNDANISDYDKSKPSLWESDLNKQKTVALWAKLAQRYANEPTIAGYDLINEPNWSFEGKDPHGREDLQNAPIWELYKDITKAIRTEDRNHLIIIEGNGWGNNYHGFDGPWDTNMALSYHKYWNPNTQASIDHIVTARKKFNMPVWLGETGENSNKWFTDCITLLENNQIGWSWWPLKKVGSVVCPLTIVEPEGYQQLADYWNGRGEKPNSDLAHKVLFQLIENLKAANCVYNRDVIDAMFRQVATPTAKPFAPNKVPGSIEAVHFDFGPEGVAYHDVNSERTGEPGKDGGNKGWTFRNDGVDIYKDASSHQATKQYYVGLTEDAEWLRYTIQVDKKASYQLSALVANEQQGSSILIEIDGKPIGLPVIVPAKTGKLSWTLLPLGKAKLTKGAHQLLVRFTGNGTNIKTLFIQ